MKKDLDKPQKVKTSLDELEVLLRLKETVEWAIFKRLAQRYIFNLQKASFKLIETDAHYLSVRHAEFAGQALGIRQLIRMVENSGKKLEKEERR
jgi:hypothetical protein